jgi:hypothetical protein
MESFALQIFSTTKSGMTVPSPHATSLILVLSALLAFVFVLACSQPTPSLAILFTTVALLGLSAPELGSLVTPIPRANTQLPAHSDWVDRTVGSAAKVSLVGGPRVGRPALRETAFWNESISRVYYTCTMAFGADFGEQQLTLNGTSEALGTLSGTLRTRYAVVPARFHVPGRILARDRLGRLALVAPAGGILRLPAASRPQLACSS